MNRIMYSNRHVKKNYIFIIAVLSTLIVSSSSISNYGYFNITKIVYGQSDPDQMNSQYYEFGKYARYPIRKSPCRRY